MQPTPVLPFYVAFDRPAAGVPALHAALGRLLSALADDHDAAALAHVAVVALGRPPEVLVPLGPVDPRPALGSPPDNGSATATAATTDAVATATAATAEPAATTDAAATDTAGADDAADGDLEPLRELIADDVRGLWSRGRAVARPVVFLLTGGPLPGSDAGPLAVTTPRLVPTALPPDGEQEDAEQLVRRWATQAAQTVLASARSVAVGGPTPVFPRTGRPAPVTALLARP